MTSRLVTFLLFVVTLPCPWRVHVARDWLARGASIAVEDHADDVLRSPDGTFAAGFYNASPTVFTFSVWFARAADRAVVWTAARARPVHSSGARVTLDARRCALVLTDYGGEVVWNSTAGIGRTTASRARLRDSGYLVLEDTAGNALWQSFDYPTDTLLPTQRLTAATRLVSRDRLLSAGYYRLGFSDYAMLSLFYDNSNFSSIYWPNPYFTYWQNNRKIYNFSREAAMDALGQFLSSDGTNFEAADLGAAGVRRRLTLDTDGNLRVYSLDEATGTWSVSWMAFGNPCNIHGVCGANAVCLYSPAPVCVCAPGHERVDASDWSRGCRPTFRLECGRPTKLVALPHSDFWGYDLNDGEIMPLHDCAKKCLENCACVVFQYKEHMECYLKSVLFNGKTFPGLPGTVYIKVPADFHVPEFHVHQWQHDGDGLATQEHIAGCTPAGDNDSDSKVQLNVSASLSARDAGKAVWPYLYGFLSALLVVEAIVISLGCWLFSSKGLFRQSRVYAVEEGYKLITSHFQRYTYAEIRKATGNFTDVIGRGGSGVVYKGVLGDDERVVAVKVLKNVSRQSEEEFQAELSVIGRIYHMNLVRMWGCCSRGKHRILVSEFIENGSLAQKLFHRVGSDDDHDVLDWNQRFRIALGVAKGLAYLHNECSEWIVHCDMKPENILLDHDLEPKITDFGLSKLLNRDGSDAALTRIRGTRGYMAPEWVSNLPVTEKVDELVKGVRVSEWVIQGIKVCEMDIRMVVRVTCEKMESNERGCTDDLVDYRLKGDFNHVQVKMMLKTAVSCLEEDRSKRPNMNSVVQALISVED
ncbi:putative receptor protein kinase ZmPK1 [Oryza brachyantha]|uniref:putative receptor protein kinase ZmPK1 n=1 Tax=Oryza brachyantha TaxID=4533 RepID=UPI001ADC5CA0|nr:putative receptor protein kinase ZmPK1 [Oryza brachyantha]